MSPRYNQPLGGNEMPRFAGPATMMRLPTAETAAGLDVAFVGVPLDIGTSHRAGTRFGPRQIRAESAMLRPYNMATRVSPFDHVQVAEGATPLTLGGDHTLTLPALRAIANAHGPVGLVHVDAHADVNEHMFGQALAHGTTFRRAVEEGLLDPARTVQIGLRGTGYADDDFDWPRAQGFRVVQAEECWHRSLAPLMDEVRALVGTGEGAPPTYLSFDIDSLDPAFAPGTGTLEIGGLTTVQALEIVRGLAGVNLVGADLVEVSPPYDQAGTTALVAANLLYEMLCVLPAVVRGAAGAAGR